MKKILLYEHDESILQVVSLFLESIPFEIIKTKTPEEAFSYLKKARPDSIIVDICLNQEKGISVIKECAKLYDPIPPIIVISALQKIEKIIENLPVNLALKKPFHLEELENALLYIP